MIGRHRKVTVSQVRRDIKSLTPSQQDALYAMLSADRVLRRGITVNTHIKQVPSADAREIVKAINELSRRSGRSALAI